MGISSVIFTLLVAMAGAAHAREAPPHAITEERTPCADYDPLRRPFFGDTHVHTALSFDARGQDTRNTPRDAYRFARGEAMGIQPYDLEGRPTRTIRLERPLDWTAVTDHAEFLGEVRMCRTPGTWVYWHPVCVLHRNSRSGNLLVLATAGLVQKWRWGFCGEEAEDCLARSADVWQEIRDAAEEAYDRSEACRFTSFVGYEWTATVGSGNNLHRNVLFRNEKVPDLPISWIETPSARDLWSHLQEDCVEGVEGCDALTIPHNSNLSGGLLFESARLTNETGRPEIDAEEAAARERWEPLVEIMQHKGDSECDVRAEIWADDEECGFEKFAYDRFGSKNSRFVEARLPSPRNFVRDALARGLAIEERTGANPFKYGIIASTDTHIAAPGLAEEKDHPGHGGAGKGGGASSAEDFPDDFEFGPGGLAVLWAEENSRDALFAAMQRREAYGTSGTRPVVRFFGGWEYPDDLCADPDLVRTGYAGGVPMGGDLPAASRQGEAAPRFVAWAARDSATDSAGLEKVQIVKGWFDGEELQERVVDVAAVQGEVAVDRATCERRGRGADVLCAVWQDPDFDASERAFYYARVLEAPSCRWSQLFCLEAGVDCSASESVPEGLQPCCSEDHRAVQRERAWTSPIWYAPSAQPAG